MNRSSRLQRRLAALMLTVAIAGCGGGGGGSGDSGGNGGGGGGPSNANPLILSLVSDAGIVPHGGGVTLQWSSDASSCSASGAWSGDKADFGSEAIAGLTQTSTFTLNCSRDNRTVQAAVRVVVTPQGVPPDATSTEVFSENGLTSLTYAILPIAPVAMVWDSHNERLHVVTAADSPEYPSSVVSIDPSTREVTAAQALDSEPAAVAASSKGEYVYVASKSHLIRRFHAADLAPDITINVGSESDRILRLAVAPKSPQTIAVIRSTPDDALAWGLQIFDDAVPRPAALLENINVTGVNWSADESTMYAQGTLHYSGTFYLSVSSEGLAVEELRRWNTESGGTLNGSIFYANDGRVYDLERPIRQLGRFTDYQQFKRHSYGSWSRAVAVDRKKAFATWPNNPNGFDEGTTLASYDLDTFTTIDKITFLGAAAFVGEMPVPWGDAGIALQGRSGLLIAEGTFAAQGGARGQDETVPVIASGTTNVGENIGVRRADAISYRTLDIDATDAVADSCGGLYVAISGISDVLPNSVISLDPSTETVRARVRLGGEPQELAVSDDCSMLYVGTHHSNSVTRIRTADFTVDQTVYLDDNFQKSETLTRAESISVAPGLPRTFAVAAADMGYSLCEGSRLGIAIFDDAVERPGTLQVDYDGPGSITWGATAETLYGDSGRLVYEYAVDATGAHSPIELFDSGVLKFTGVLLYNIGRNLTFDPLTGRLLDPFGQVYLTDTRELAPPIDLVYPTDKYAACDPPTAAKAVDPRTGRIYFGSLTGQRLGLSAVDRQSLSVTTNFSFPWHGQYYMEPLGSPVRLARLDDGLALLTDQGHLTIAKGAALAQ